MMQTDIPELDAPVAGEKPHDHRHEQMEAAAALIGDSTFSEQVDRLVLHFGPDIAGPNGVGGAVRARMIIEEMLDELAENGMLAGHSRSPP